LTAFLPILGVSTIHCRKLILHVITHNSMITMRIGLFYSIGSNSFLAFLDRSAIVRMASRG